MASQFTEIEALSTMPFKSKAQPRFPYSQHPDIAARWVKETPNIKNLPERSKKVAKRKVRRKTQKGDTENKRAEMMMTEEMDKKHKRMHGKKKMPSMPKPMPKPPMMPRPSAGMPY